MYIGDDKQRLGYIFRKQKILNFFENIYHQMIFVSKIKPKCLIFIF